jgi:hypothetical protein
MADEKVTSHELLKLRRHVALRELALAVSYPQTHTGVVSHRKREHGAVPVTQDKGWPDPSVSLEDVQMHNVVNARLADRLHAAAPPTSSVATSRDLDQRQRRYHENSNDHVTTAKPWKKPWDK